MGTTAAMAPAERVSYPVEAGALVRVPIYYNHRRARNWLATIRRDPGSPGGLARTFARRAYGEFIYMVDTLRPGQAVEFGADYYSGSGRKNPDRRYYVVVEVTSDSLVLDRYETAAQACKASSLAREGDSIASVEADQERLLYGES